MFGGTVGTVGSEELPHAPAFGAGPTCMPPPLASQPGRTLPVRDEVLCGARAADAVQARPRGLQALQLRHHHRQARVGGVALRPAERRRVRGGGMWGSGAEGHQAPLARPPISQKPPALTLSFTHLERAARSASCRAFSNTSAAACSLRCASSARRRSSSRTCSRGEAGGAGGRRGGAWQRDSCCQLLPAGSVSRRLHRPRQHPPARRSAPPCAGP